MALVSKASKGLDGKVALVTGGGKGIGRAIALALSARGTRVVVTGRDERALGETVGEIAYGGGKARHLAGDVRDVAHLEAAVGRAREVFGGLDFVIANAGQSGRVPVGEDLERGIAILETNLIGVYKTFHSAIPRMNDGGRLLAMSSLLASIGAAGYAAYGASKAGLEGLVRAVAHDVAGRRITCNAISAGWTDSPMADAGIAVIAEASGKPTDAARGEVTAGFPLGRFLEPEEVAEVALFLCSDAGSAITGQTLPMGGS